MKRNAEDPLTITEETSLREVAYKKLKQAILSGRFAPGERLVERELADTMRVSRTPIREALRRLERESLVKTVPYKGPSVVQLTNDEAHQLFELRAVLEGMAACLCTQRAGPEILQELRECLTQSRGAAESGDMEQLLDWNNRFHELVAKGANNVPLEEHLVELRQRILLLRSNSMTYALRRSEMLREHQRIVDYIAEGRAEEARDATERHVLAAEEYALSDQRDDLTLKSRGTKA